MAVALSIRQTLTARQVARRGLAPPLKVFLPHRTVASQHSPGQSNGGSASSSKASNPAPRNTKYEKQRRNEWIIIGVSGAVASLGGWLWYHRSSAKKPTSPVPSTDDTMSFVISSRSSVTGERVRKVLKMLTPAEASQRLKQNEKIVDLGGEKARCLVARYDVNSVASNDPIEDRSAQIIVERDGFKRKQTGGSQPTLRPALQEQSPQNSEPLAPVGDLAFFAVMDGHAGWQTSSYLSQKLVAFVALELDKVFRETGEYGAMAKARASLPGKLWKSIVGDVQKSGPAPTDAPVSTALCNDPEIVKRAISKAFVGLDKEICNTPVELLKEYELSLAATASDSASSASPDASGRSLSSLAHSVFPTPGSSSGDGHASMTATQKSAHETMLPALSGSCALLTYIDSATRDVYVACTGDSRAIGGWQDTQTGQWTIEPLSEDQTGRNPNEVSRMRKEHPVAESERVIINGRVLGGLEPTRAFGDARYKWSRDVQERLHNAFLPGGRDKKGRGPPRLLETPPYVTARPEIQWRRLPASRSQSQSSDPASTDVVGPTTPKQGLSSSTKQLRFIVMATDGLWDMLSNEHAGALVAGHLANMKGTATASELEQKFLAQRSPPSSLVSSLSSAVSSVVSPPEASTSASAGSQTSASPTQSPAQASQGLSPLTRTSTSEPSFVFEDNNLATHLIRNALGGADGKRTQALLAIPAPDARRYRDDVTVNVILLHGDDPSASQSDAATNSGAASPSAGVKSKL